MKQPKVNKAKVEKSDNFTIKITARDLRKVLVGICSIKGKDLTQEQIDGFPQKYRESISVERFIDRYLQPARSR